MTKTWPLQDAKNRFSELVDEAGRGGPQIVTRRGREAAVVLSIEDYRRMTAPADTLIDFFRRSPWVGVDLDLERSRELPREVDL